MNEITVSATRLPWSQSFEDQYGKMGVKRATWRAITEQLYPTAKSLESVLLVLAYCEARKLDPFKKPVHIVPVYDGQLKRMVDTVWPGISELRTTAMRTKNYGGCDLAEFGPSIELDLDGLRVRVPEWSRMTQYRFGRGNVRFPVVGPITYWIENYATRGRDSDAPNAMWLKRPIGQLEKCAEAASLRRAFPEELGNEYAAEEMEGRWNAPPPLEPGPVSLHAGFSPAPVLEPEGPPDDPIGADYEVVTPGSTDELPVRDDTPPGDVPQASLPEGTAFDLVLWAAELNRTLADYAGVDELREDWAVHKDQLKAENPGLFAELNKAVALRAGQIGGMK